MEQNHLAWLENMYAQLCDGDWEHQHGIRLTTLDNPGWRLDVDLAASELEPASFERRIIERSDADWFQYWVENGIFKAAGGARNLQEMIGALREIIEGPKD